MLHSTPSGTSVWFVAPDDLKVSWPTVHDYLAAAARVEAGKDGEIRGGSISAMTVDEMEEVN
jgi:hypothetical protein